MSTASVPSARNRVKVTVPSVAKRPTTRPVNEAVTSAVQNRPSSSVSSTSSPPRHLGRRPGGSGHHPWPRRRSPTPAGAISMRSSTSCAGQVGRPGLPEPGDGRQRGHPGAVAAAARLERDVVLLVVAERQAAGARRRVDDGRHRRPEVPLAAADEPRVRVVERAAVGRRSSAGRASTSASRRRPAGSARPSSPGRRATTGRRSRSPRPRRRPSGPAGPAPATGQSSAHATSVMNVSRPSGENDWVAPSGRMPSMTSAEPPSGVSTRSAWPVFWIGRDGAAGAEHRVARVALERALDRRPAREAHAVAALGAALGDHQVPVLAAPVEVRRLGELQAGARPERARLLQRPCRPRGRRAPAGCPRCLPRSSPNVTRPE